MKMSKGSSAEYLRLASAITRITYFDGLNMIFGGLLEPSYSSAYKYLVVTASG
jgi:hypothetical protein